MPDGTFIIPGGPSFSGSPQPPDVPPDPSGDGWQGPPGPPGPTGPQGPQGLPGDVTAGVASFNARTGTVSLTSGDVTGAGGALTNGTPIGSTTPSTGYFSRGGTSSVSAQTHINIGGVVDGPAVNANWSSIRWFGKSGGVDASTGDMVAGYKYMLQDNSVQPTNMTGAVFSFLSITGSTDPANIAHRYASMARTATSGLIGEVKPLGTLATAWMAIGSVSHSYSTVSQGGYGGWTPANNPSLGYFRGIVCGGLDNAWLATGASNYGIIFGREIDTAILGTANTSARYGLAIVSNTSARQADIDDAGLFFAVQTKDANNHKNAIQFGGSGADHVVSDSLIKVVSRQYPSPVASSYVTGIDFTQGTFSGNAIATPGFAVSGAGRVAPLLTNAANDAAAAAAGVPVGAMYRNANAVMVRLV